MKKLAATIWRLAAILMLVPGMATMGVAGPETDVPATNPETAATAPQTEQMRRDVYEDAIRQGIQMYRAERYDRAFDLLSRTAVQGDKESQYLIGLMYLKGQGVDKHTLRGLAWMKTAAESKMAEWVRNYRKVTKPLNKAQLARVEEQAALYIKLYGMEAQSVKCKNETIRGSYRKRYVCRKESGWVLDGEWDLPSMREFEQYHITQ